MKFTSYKQSCLLAAAAVILAGLASRPSAAAEPVAPPQFRRLPGGLLKSKVPGRPKTEQARSVTFPVTGSVHDKIKKGFHMETSFTIRESGAIDGQTKVWSNVSFKGFTGGMAVVVRDQSGQELYHTPLRRWGVNGKHMGDGGSRTEQWFDSIPGDALQHMAEIRVVHSHEPKNRILENWDEFVKYGKIAWRIFVESQSDRTTSGPRPDFPGPVYTGK